MMNDHRRETPLADCPNLTCRRAGICHHLAERGNCLKTTFASHDDWCDYMAAKIRKFHASCNFPPRDPSLPKLSESEALSIVYKAFERRRGRPDSHAFPKHTSRVYIREFHPG